MRRPVGLNRCETDLRRAAIVIYDDLLDQTSNGSSAVVLRDLDVIRTLDAGSWLAPEFAVLQIPTFEEIVACALRLNLGLQVELKPTIGDDIETAGVVMPILKRLWPADNHKLFVSSFSVGSLTAARRLRTDVPLAIASVVAPVLAGAVGSSNTLKKT
ncbi:hypothetical protein PSCICJ_14230 [Pseudomonas cichorii]|nr:hypothetical protein PSCICJ_14230 [Pseudomonas cichorii]